MTFMSADEMCCKCRNQDQCRKRDLYCAGRWFRMKGHPKQMDKEEESGRTDTMAKGGVVDDLP